MLIMTSRTGESVMIGDKGEIVVTVLSVSGNQIRIGYTAPKEIPIHREKIFNRIQKEKGNGQVG